MTIFKIYEYVLTFDFEINYLGRKEYLMIKDEVFEKLSIADFKNVNFYCDDKFIIDKLKSLRDQLSYFNKILKHGLDNFEETDESRALFPHFLKELQSKGGMPKIDKVTGNVRVISFFIEDLIDLIEHRIELINSLLSGFDYNFSEEAIHYKFVPSSGYKKFYTKRGYPIADEWIQYKISKIQQTELSGESRALFKHSDAFNEFWRLIEQYRILEMQKYKVCLFIRKLEMEDYFKSNIKLEELATFTTNATKYMKIKGKKPYTAKGLTAGIPTDERWEEFIRDIKSEFKMTSFK